MSVGPKKSLLILFLVLSYLGPCPRIDGENLLSVGPKNRSSQPRDLKEVCQPRDSLPSAGVMNHYPFMGDQS